MKILVAATEICGQINLFADGFRQLGHTVTTAVVQKSDMFPEPYDYDFTTIPNTIERFLEIGYLFGNNDLFFYQWSRQGLLPDVLDLPYLHFKGKTVVSACMGSDVRHYASLADWYVPLKEHIKKVEFPPELVEVSLRTLRRVERYSSVVLSQANQSILGIRPYHNLFIPVDLRKITEHIPNNPVPKIVHIPSRRYMKGTEYYIAALESLKNEGLQFEFKLLENIPNAQVMQELREADIVIDELYFPLHGKTTIEGWASGCVVVNGNDQYLEPFPENRPVWTVTPDNMKERLRVLITDHQQRFHFATLGRPHVEKYHDHVNVCRYILETVANPQASKLVHWPRYYYDRFDLGSETIPEDLLQLTSEIIHRHGLPADINISRLISKGLLRSTISGDAGKLPQWRI